MSTHSVRKSPSTVSIADVETEDDKVQTTILSESEHETSAKMPESKEELPGTEEAGNEDFLLLVANQLELTEEMLTDITQVCNNDMQPDHQNPSPKPVEIPDKKHHDSDNMTSNEDRGDDLSKIRQQSPSHEETSLLSSPYGDGDGPDRRHLDSPDSEASLPRPEGAAGTYTPSYDEYTLLLQQLNEERANAIEHNKKLQMKLAPILAKKTKEEVERVLQGPMHMESYERCLEVLTELKEKMKEDRAVAERKIEVLRVQAEEKLSKVDEQWHDLLSLKRDAAVMVLNRRLTKHNALARVESALSSEQMYQEELTRVRLQNFFLENRIHKLEREISEADRNATNPFQREYEKLHAKRMERKKYMEKQTEEALRVKKRVVRNLKMLSDIKKTIHCIETEIQQKCEELAQVDTLLAQKRNTLASIKHARNGLQKDNMRLKKTCGLLGNEVLLRDYDHMNKANAGLEEKLKDLKYRRADVQFYLRRGRKRVETI